MAKIYTSRFSNPELRTGNYTVVGIVRGLPKFPLKYPLAGNIIQCAPPGYLFNVYDRAEFTPKYFQHMNRTGIWKVNQLLEQYLSYGKDVVLCCYEDVREENEWCHRLVFAEWYEKQTGIKVCELPDPTEPKKAKPEKKQIEVQKEPEKPEATQMSIFDFM